MAGVFAARTRQRAVDLNRRGAYQAASEQLKATARKIRSYANGDPELGGIIDGLLQEAELFGRVMEERNRKELYFASASMLRSRDGTDKARCGGV